MRQNENPEFNAWVKGGLKTEYKSINNPLILKLVLIL